MLSYLRWNNLKGFNIIIFYATGILNGKIFIKTYFNMSIEQCLLKNLRVEIIYRLPLPPIVLDLI